MLVQIALCFPLRYRYGATGAAIAYAIPVISLYSTLAVVAARELRRMDEHS